MTKTSILAVVEGIVTIYSTTPDPTAAAVSTIIAYSN